MKMHQKVNQALSKVNLLSEIIETIRKDVSDIPSKKYMFVTSLNWDKPRVSAWSRGCIGATDETAEFGVSEDTVSIIDKGRYSDETVLEMLNIIQDWLQTEIS